MSEPTMNQYAPPVAQVADVAPPTVTAPLKLFSFQGRIGRLRYLAYSCGASLVYGLIIGVLTALLVGTGAMVVATVLAIIALLVFNVMIGVRRCHDVGASGWWALSVIIPLVAFIWMFVPGNKGDNRFGPPPPPNTWGVRVLAMLLPVFAIIGILAAVAIPAYQTYVNKARAAQEGGQR